MARTFKIVVDKEGYPVINGAGPECIRKNGKKDRRTMALHRAVVMDALGITSYGSGYRVHHCDSNRLNCAFDNLILVSADTHRAIHLAQIQGGGGGGGGEKGGSDGFGRTSARRGGRAR